MSTEQRKDTRRLALGPGFSIRFTAQGQTLEVPILNLSYGGCFTLVPFREARRFDRGVPVSDLQLLHPELPKGLLQGLVAYTLGGTAGIERMEQVGMGIQFLDVDPITQQALQTWLDREWDKKGL
mgnify:CR=1 FL=1